MKIKIRCDFCGDEFSPNVNITSCPKPECKKAYHKAYNQRPEVKAHQKACNKARRDARIQLSKKYADEYKNLLEKNKTLINKGKGGNK